MMGVDAGDSSLQTTTAYYQSSQVFLTRSADRFEVSDWASPALQKARWAEALQGRT